MKGGSTRVLGILLFILIGASALVLGVMNTGNSISSPLQADEAATKAFSDAINGGDQAAKIAELKNKDTDGDGLNDYEETYVYRTSPYIKDTDSDGLIDSVEIKDGSDPNCPQGKVCETQAPVVSNGNTNVGGESSLVLPDISDLESDALPPVTIADAAEIRALLKDQGLSDTVLDSIDDATLIQMYNESINSVNGTAANLNTGTNDSQ